MPFTEEFCDMEVAKPPWGDLYISPFDKCSPKNLGPLSVVSNTMYGDDHVSERYPEFDGNRYVICNIFVAPL